MGHRTDPPGEKKSVYLRKRPWTNSSGKLKRRWIDNNKKEEKKEEESAHKSEITEFS